VGERDALDAWVVGGGVLVTTDTRDGALRFLHGMTLPASRSPAPVSPTGQSAEVGTPDADGAGDDEADLPLARDVAAAHSETVDTISPRGGQGASPGARVDRLYADYVGLRVAGSRRGAGQVILVADSSFLANQWIGEDDNAVLAANLVAYAASQARGPRVAFDEYHFGFGSHETGWTVMLGLVFASPAGWAILTVTAAGLAFLVYKGRRFGTRLAPVRTRRRSKLEYVHALGATYRAAGAHRLVLGILFDSVKREVARAHGLPAGAPTGDLAAAAARRTGSAPKAYADVMIGCEQAMARPRLSGHACTILLDRLATMESEIRDAGPGPG